MWRQLKENQVQVGLRTNSSESWWASRSAHGTPGLSSQDAVGLCQCHFQKKCQLWLSLRWWRSQGLSGSDWVQFKRYSGIVGASQVAQWIKNPAAMQEMQVQFLVQEDPLEEGMAAHFSILAWRIQWTEEPGRLQSIGSQTVGYDWSD